MGLELRTIDRKSESAERRTDMLVDVVLSAALRIFMSLFSGSQQFSCYSGFSDSFEWAGPYKDLLERYEHSNYVPKI